MANAQVDEKILDKIRKILSLAGNNPSENEAQSAMLKAQAMLAEYGLSMEDVAADDEQPKKKQVNTEQSGEIGRNLWWRLRLHQVIAENFRCASVIFTYRSKKLQKLAFIGTGADAQIAKEIFEFALKSIKSGGMKCCKQFRKAGTSTEGKRDSYRKGFIDGLDKKFQDQKAAHQEWGLVLVKPKEVEEHIAETCKPTDDEFSRNLAMQEMKMRLGYNAEAGKMGFKDGYEFGESTNPSKKKLK